MIVGDEGLFLQNVIEVMHAANGLVTLAQAPVIVLIDLDVGAQAWRGMMEINADSVHELNLGALVHHMDQGLFTSGRSGEYIQILCNRSAFGDERPVFEF